MLSGADLTGRWHLPLASNEDPHCSNLVHPPVKTMIMESIDRNDLDVLETLLKSGADPNFSDEHSELPLNAAIMKAGPAYPLEHLTPENERTEGSRVMYQR